MCHKVFIGRSFPNGTHFFLSKACFGMRAIKSCGYSKTGLGWNGLNQDTHYIYYTYTHKYAQTHSHIYIYIWVKIFTYIHTCFVLQQEYNIVRFDNCIFCYSEVHSVQTRVIGGNRGKGLERKRQFLLIGEDNC